MPFEVGLEAVEELRAAGPRRARRWRRLALRWILMNEAVTCVIPGGKRPSQVDDNAAAADLPALSPDDDGADPRRSTSAGSGSYVHPYW